MPAGITTVTISLRRALLELAQERAKERARELGVYYSFSEYAAALLRDDVVKCGKLRRKIEDLEAELQRLKGDAAERVEAELAVLKETFGNHVPTQVPPVADPDEMVEHDPRPKKPRKQKRPPTLNKEEKN